MTSAYSPERVRAGVPGLHDVVFLNAASMGAPPKEALDAVTGALDHLAAGPLGTSWGGYVEEFERGVALARGEAATLLHAHPDEIAFVGDTTAGLHHAIEAIPFRAGDNVLVSDLEYPQVALAAADAVRNDGVEIRWVEHRGGRLTVDDYRAAADGRTRAILASSVSWTNGLRLDLAALSELATERDLFLVVDAIQQLGALTLDVSSLAIDFLTSGAYKWLNAPFGVGIFYASRRALGRGLRIRRLGLAGLGPPAEGWGRFFESPAMVPLPDLAPSGTALRFDPQGTPPRVGCAGLAAALRWRNELGEAADRHVLDLSGELLGELASRGIRILTPDEDRDRAGIVAFTLDGNPDTDRSLCRFLEARRIYTTVRYCSGIGGVRAAIHVYTTPDEVNTFLEALDGFRSGAR
jgi:cysteine desulfurase / selenocysteine lyase